MPKNSPNCHRVNVSIDIKQFIDSITRANSIKYPDDIISSVSSYCYNTKSNKNDNLIVKTQNVNFHQNTPTPPTEEIKLCLTKR